MRSLPSAGDYSGLLLTGDIRFLRAFRNKGRLSVVLERMPVHMIHDS
jgi:glucokinase